jgi:hypothetical protein
MSADQPEETRLELAKGYLAEYLADEDGHGDRSQIWFGQLGEYVMQLPLGDEVIAKAAVWTASLAVMVADRPVAGPDHGARGAGAGSCCCGSR